MRNEARPDRPRQGSLVTGEARLQYLPAYLARTGSVRWQLSQKRNSCQIHHGSGEEGCADIMTKQREMKMSGQEKTKMTSAAHITEIAIPDVANQRWKLYLKKKGQALP